MTKLEVAEARVAELKTERAVEVAAQNLADEFSIVVDKAEARETVVLLAIDLFARKHGRQVFNLRKPRVTGDGGEKASTKTDTKKAAGKAGK